MGRVLTRLLILALEGRAVGRADGKKQVVGG